MDLSSLDRQRTSAAIHAAEAKSSGEIVCVMARSSNDPKPVTILVAALAALALPWFLLALTALPVDEILWLQLSMFFGLMLLLDLPWLRLILPPVLRRWMAQRAAMEQFALRGIGRSQGRAGILIFVSLEERYARIVVDEAVADRVDPSEWQGAVDALVGHMSDGRIADGFVEAIDRCGRVLETHFPRTAADHDQPPERLYLL